MICDICQRDVIVGYRGWYRHSPDESVCTVEVCEACMNIAPPYVEFSPSKMFGEVKVESDTVEAIWLISHAHYGRELEQLACSPLYTEEEVIGLFCKNVQYVTETGLFGVGILSPYLPSDLSARRIS